MENTYGLELTEMGKSPVIFGNLLTSPVIDTDRMLLEIDECYNSSNGFSEHQQGLSNHSVYDYLPSLTPLRDVLIPFSLSMFGYDPSKFKITTWVNVFEKGRGLHEHIHPTPCHGYLVLRNNGTKTRFSAAEPFVLDNNPGQFIHVNGRFRHRVGENTSDVTRVSVAWDCYDLSWDEQSHETKTFTFYRLK